ncbi:MAG: HD-GYP domain-containing protein [Undibacterium sp.]|nr:HD-GYP domain-containing protein [Undibacterium sp.]
MLKKINLNQLRKGMYIQELCTSWMSSPFWQKSFLIEDNITIEKIRNAGVEAMWIDTDKGCDVLAAVEVLEKDQVSTPTPIEVSTSQAVERRVLSEVLSVSMDAELGRAAKIVGKSKSAVCTMFGEARMGKAIDAEQAMSLVEEIAESVMRNPGALIGLARLKTVDDYTYMHSVAVCALMISLARQLGLSDDVTRELGLAGLLHDIGKMQIPSAILNKPGKLTDEEFVLVKAHPRHGHQMLLEAKEISEISLDVCLHHHEKVDGGGYPEALSGEQISLYAKMGAVCDVYDAITSNRPYKQGWCPAESIKKMSEWSKGHFDEKVFQAFVRSIGIYPVGTLVKLQSGRLGVVIEQQVGKSLLLPKVRAFFSTRSMAFISPVLLDLAGPGNQDKIVSREDASTWGLKDISRYWLGDAAGQN